MLFSNPVKGVIHLSAEYYPNDPGAWKRPAGNTDFALVQKFGPTTLAIEPTVVWPGGEGIPAKTYPDFHTGIDLGNKGCGAAIIAAGPGKIIAKTKDGAGALYVKIDHGSGFVTGYWHMASFAPINVGDIVPVGKVLGYVGKTGLAYACHLHFQMWKNGKIVDPWRRLKQNTSVDPDAVVAAPVGADMPTLTAYLPGQVATLLVKSNIRKAPSLTGAVIRLTSAAETWLVTGWVKGDLVSGSDQWLCRWNAGQWEYAHKVTVASGPAPLPAGITQAQVSAAVLAARQSQYDQDGAAIVVTDPAPAPATAKLSNSRPV